MKIEKIYVREILDSNGNPTIETTIEFQSAPDLTLPSRLLGARLIMPAKLHPKRPP